MSKKHKEHSYALLKECMVMQFFLSISGSYLAIDLDPHFQVAFSASDVEVVPLVVCLLDL